MARWVTTLFLLSSLLSACRSGGTEKPSVSVIRNGITVTLFSDRSSYPKDALVLFTVRVRNDSSHAISLPKNPFCGYDYDPDIQIVSSQASPLDLGVPGPPSCGPPDIALAWPVIHLQPGASIDRKVPAIIWAPDVRATFGPWPAQGRSMQTPTLHLRLTYEPPPRTTVHEWPSIHAELQPQRPLGGRLWFVEAFRCGNGFTSDPEWRSTAGRRVPWTAGLYFGNCHTPYAGWQVVAGWPGHRVATISWHWTGWDKMPPSATQQGG